MRKYDQTGRTGTGCSGKGVLYSCKSPGKFRQDFKSDEYIGKPALPRSIATLPNK